MLGRNGYGHWLLTGISAIAGGEADEILIGHRFTINYRLPADDRDAVTRPGNYPLDEIVV